MRKGVGTFILAGLEAAAWGGMPLSPLNDTLPARRRGSRGLDRIDGELRDDGARRASAEAKRMRRKERNRRLNACA
jgi:hypothetical protein